MRPQPVFLFLLGLLVSVPATAEPITFGRGPVTCVAHAPGVTDARVLDCSYGRTSKQSWGTCQASIVKDGVLDHYYVSAIIDQTNKHHKQNSIPLSFARDNVTCTVEEPSIVSVHNCRSLNRGKTRQCEFCVKVDETEGCYSALLTIDKVPQLSKDGKVVESKGNERKNKGN